MTATANLAIQPLFPMALGRVQLAPDPLDTALWLQRALAFREQVPSEEGVAWTGDVRGAGELHRDPLFAPLITRLADHAWQYLAALGFDRRRVALHVQRSWPVISDAGEQVGRHHHPNAHLSAVYYLNGDGSGRSGCLRLFAPRQVNELVPGLALGQDGPIDTASALNQPWHDVAPLAGLLLLFPSSVDHAVLPNDDPDDTRFSLSIDFVLTAPEAAPHPGEYLAPHPVRWLVIGEDGKASGA
ncbi:2OG-Fe(II) oxygenase family protein [Synechococcus sp. CS-1332]|uniref:2OG-Fe(II) oxygenase family protein n=1 Tax=Synechococcus sp. CS-1332 TaxID=2847972 RepID=UPI00223C2FFF|nr:2OG-Fe(II) oxygenase family protein [Synechococcus sp. CS-1332]